MFCHFRISVAGAPPQTVVFQLHTDKCPKTCDNFIALCQSSATAKRPSASALSTTPAHGVVVQPTYRGTDFHRILPGFMIQGGDFTKFDGSGGYAAPTTNSNQQTFPDENFDISHDREGILSMANRGKNTNGSQFFITLGKTLHLDGKHVAFGTVVRGMEVVREIARVETEGNNGRPVMLQRVMIVDCGVGTGDDDGDGDASSDSDSSSSSSSSVDDRRKRSKKKKHRRSSRSDDEESYHKKRKRSRDRSRHSKHRKHSDKDDRKRRKRKDKSSHRHRSEDSSSEEYKDSHSSSKNRHKGDRRSDDDRHHRKKKSDRR